MPKNYSNDLDRKTTQGLLLAFPRMNPTLLDDRLGRLPMQVKFNIVGILANEDRITVGRNIQRYYDNYLRENPGTLPNYSRAGTFRAKINGLPSRMARFSGEGKIYYR